MSAYIPTTLTRWLLLSAMYMLPSLGILSHDLSGEVGHTIFIAGLEQSEEWCARCGCCFVLPIEPWSLE